MFINGKQYETVTEYVYLNLFKNDRYRRKMKDHLYPTPYPSAIALFNESDMDIFTEGLVDAARIQFNNSLRFRNALFQLPLDKHITIRNIPEVYVDQLRAFPLDKSHVFHDATHGVVDQAEVLAVLAVIEAAVIENPLLQSLTYPQARQLMLDTPKIKHIKPVLSLGALVNLDKIVETVKDELGLKIYTNVVDVVKRQLLDAYLDHILETEYSTVAVENYKAAKRQNVAQLATAGEPAGRAVQALIERQLDPVNPADYELAKRQNIDRLEREENGLGWYLDNLFELYIYDKLDPQIIAGRVNPQFPADLKQQFAQTWDKERQSLTSLLNPPEEAEAEAEVEPAIVTEGGVDVYVIDEESPLHPMFFGDALYYVPSADTVDLARTENRPIPTPHLVISILHYAYRRLFDNVDMAHVNVNEFGGLDDLIAEYTRAKFTYIENKLTERNEYALHLKFSNASMAQLLRLTDQRPLIWNDRTDGVLGIGDRARGTGGNRMGTALEFFRNLTAPSTDVISRMQYVTNPILMQSLEWVVADSLLYLTIFNEPTLPYLLSFLDQTYIDTYYGRPVTGALSLLDIDQVHHQLGESSTAIYKGSLSPVERYYLYSIGFCLNDHHLADVAKSTATEVVFPADVPYAVVKVIADGGVSYNPFKRVIVYLLMTLLNAIAAGTDESFQRMVTTSFDDTEPSEDVRKKAYGNVHKTFKMIKTFLSYDCFKACVLTGKYIKPQSGSAEATQETRCVGDRKNLAKSTEACTLVDECKSSQNPHPLASDVVMKRFITNPEEVEAGLEEPVYKVLKFRTKRVVPPSTDQPTPPVVSVTEFQWWRIWKFVEPRFFARKRKGETAGEAAATVAEEARIAEALVV